MATQQTKQGGAQTAKTDANQPARANPSVQETMRAGQDQFVSAVKAGQDVLTQHIHNVSDIARTQIGQGANALVTNSTDATNFTKSQVDAVVAASTNVVEGVESLNREVMSFTKKQLDEQVQLSRQALGVSSVRELVQLQQDFARQSVDGLLDQSTKMTELMFKIANDALQPLQTQASNAMDRAVTAKTAA